MQFKYNLRDLIVETNHLILYFVSKFVPKNNNLWIFGAWKGEKYSDNSKYLFEYVTSHNPEIKAIWLTKNKLAYKLVKQKKLPVAYFGSWKATLTCMRAGKAITCVNPTLDLPSYAISTKTIQIQLWHGLGPKAYNFADTSQGIVESINSMDFVSKLINKLVMVVGLLLTGKWFNNIKWLPYYQPIKLDLVITTSKLGIEKMKAVFGNMADKIEILGYPRHDSLVGVTREQNKQIRALYAPTHRTESDGEVVTNIDGLCEVLKHYTTIELLIKLHDLTSIEMDKLAPLVALQNCRIIGEDEISQDIYSILPTIDVLITDYSSIYTDYLILDRPIVFTPFDEEQYQHKDKGFFMDYDKVTPGPKSKDWSETLEYVATSNNWVKQYADDRKTILELFHEIRDGQSCERITQRLLKLSDELPDIIPN